MKTTFVCKNQRELTRIVTWLSCAGVPYVFRSSLLEIEIVNQDDVKSDLERALKLMLDSFSSHFPNGIEVKTAREALERAKA